ncbi:hypothetical protein pb186bvf_019204 [Paramecium bursaria]
MSNKSIKRFIYAFQNRYTEQYLMRQHLKATSEYKLFQVPPIVSEKQVIPLIQNETKRFY